MKICSKCNLEKELKSFYKDKSHLDGLTSSCKECYKLYKNNNKELQQKWAKNNYENNKNEIKLFNKEYYNNNKEQHFNRMKKWNELNPDYSKNYSKENKDKINKKRRELHSLYPEKKIKAILRNRLIELLIKNKSKKSKSALFLIGCEIKEAILYIESLFFPEMSWENHGVIWEIDHIIPCSSFDFNIVEEQQKCFHYTNLQPLFKTTKIAKSFGYNNIIGNRNKPKYL